MHRLRAMKTMQTTIEVERKFEELKNVWIRDTRFFSISAQKIVHPAYLKIIKFAEAAVPLILNELQRRPDFWFAALEAITEENPVPAEHLGDVRAMAQDWIEWGRRRGYVT